MKSYRPIASGMGQAVAERTILRKKPDGELEHWGDVAHRVALGNSSLIQNDDDHFQEEYKLLNKHVANATTVMSGRHLQHGDADQPKRPMEIFTNCGKGDTKILTIECGVTTLEEIAGKTVTVRCHDGKWRSAEAKSYGEQELYKLSFVRSGVGSKSYREVFFTRNHRWVLEDGSVTDNIKCNDKLMILPVETNIDDDAVIHGIIFGDGSAHKTRIDCEKKWVSQGRTYASIRVCKQDSVRDEIIQRFNSAGYESRTPSWANGDSVFYMGKNEGIKDLPFTTDPSYIAGFIRGWWLADGSKTESSNGTWTISTSNTMAADWLVEHSAYAGLTVVSRRLIERQEGDGSYPNGKPLHIIRLREGVQWKLDSIEYFGKETVYCVEEPITKSFTLANGIVTGNCSTSPTSFMLFYLLLNGSGVGRCYDDDMMLVNWDNAPTLRCVLSSDHADFDYSSHESLRDANHKYGHDYNTIWFEIPDSREGWGKAIELWETLAFEKIHKDKMLILDFSKVRPKGSPIKGMQNRPSSGPAPLINAFNKAASLKGSGLSPWKQTMYIDHYFAECVLVGGARRAARMSTKSWLDLTTILDFIKVKRPIEYDRMTTEEIISFRQNSDFQHQSFLWSSNNSVMVDDDFWRLIEEGGNDLLSLHARKVFDAITESAYATGTGEPGIINAHKLVQKDEGWTDLNTGDYVASDLFQTNEDTQVYLSKLAKKARRKKHHMIVNPCGEITLNVLGGFCTISDVIPYHAETIEEAEEAFRTVTRAMIRVNTMDSIYKKEVDRTNRIGIAITGVHEFAYKFFGHSFRDLIDEEKSKDFWLTMARFNRAVKDEAEKYSKKLGVNVPHTMTTIKPSGTVSKLFMLTEGWHLPSMRKFLRWVQFRSDDPLIEKYRAANYPIRDLVQYSGTTIVGFPTAPVITEMGMGDKLVTAAEATPEEQFQWLMLGEKYWIHGTDGDGIPVKDNYGNQISYTLKYKPEIVDLNHFKDMILKYQSKVKCCSVMPQEDISSYEYQPEEQISEERYNEIVRHIEAMAEDIGKEHVICESGGCPIDFNEGEK